MGRTCRTSLGEESAESLIRISGLALFGQVSIGLVEGRQLARVDRMGYGARKSRGGLENMRT